MAITRRQALVSAGAAALASSLAKPAIAAKEPIRMGYLPALTGPSSSTGIGINRGVQLAVEEINAAGGIDGRPIELITRDTQSDPTKAVNGAAELSKGEKVSVVLGPVNSGDVLPKMATTGTSSAAATCIGPVSLVKSTRQSFKSDMSSRKEVWPHKLRIANCELRISDSIRFAISESFLPPNKIQTQFVCC